MKKALFLLIILSFMVIGAVFADDNAGLRDYDGIEVPKGTFIPVISNQEISTQYFDVGTKVKFTSSNDIYLYETDVIPKNTEFLGYVEKLNEPVIGTNASMVIKVIRLKLPDGFETPMKGYIYVNGGMLIGGELTPPATYDKKMSLMQNYYTMLGNVPGSTRQMGVHTVIASGADLMIILVAPLYITHTVIN